MNFEVNGNLGYEMADVDEFAREVRSLVEMIEQIPLKFADLWEIAGAIARIKGWYEE